MYSFRLHGQNKRFVKYFLCRLSTYIEEESGEGNNFVKYFTNPDSESFEIEHIWSNHFEQHNEFEQKDEFDDWRNCIGALVLLPHGSNQSLKDKPAKEKLEHYSSSFILLTRSLSKNTYENKDSNKNGVSHNFLKFIKDENLDNYFKGYDDFKKEDIQERCQLYTALAEKIWTITLD